MPANLITMGAIDFGILVAGGDLVENVIHIARERRPSSRRDMLGLVAHAAFDVSRPTFYSMAIIDRGADPGVHAPARRGPESPAARADPTRSPLVGALVLALTLVRAVRRRARPARLPRARDPGRSSSRRAGYRRLVRALLGRRWIAFRDRGALVAGAALAAAQASASRSCRLDEGDLVIFVEMPRASRWPGARRPARRPQAAARVPRGQATLSEQGRPEDAPDEGVT